jgi:hypothetical protein
MSAFTFKPSFWHDFRIYVRARGWYFYLLSERTNASIETDSTSYESPDTSWNLIDKAVAL